MDIGQTLLTKVIVHKYIVVMIHPRGSSSWVYKIQPYLRKEKFKMSNTKQMLRITAISSVIFILLLVVGCNTSAPPVTTDDSTASISIPSPTQSGKTETFNHDGLRLEVTNVHDVRVESMIDDGGNPWKYRVFVCYPGANVTVLSADMSDASISADGKPHAKWGVNLVSGERINIVDDINSFDVTPDILGIYNLEASLYVLKFEMYKNYK